MKRRHVKVGFPWCVFCFSFFIFQIFCEERYMNYSTLEVQETKNSSLALFDLQGVSLIHCGSLCLAEYCCKKFMYHKGSMRCLGIQFEDFDITGNTNLITTADDGMSTYSKGTLLYITTIFPPRYILVCSRPLYTIGGFATLSLSLSLSLSQLSQLLSFLFSLSINYCND